MTTTPTKRKTSPYPSYVNTPEFQRLSPSEKKASIGFFENQLQSIRERQQASRERKIARRQVKREAKQARAYFTNALKKNSPESQQARAGTKLVRGISSSLRGGSGRGLRAVVKLPRVQATGWSDLGLIAGSPFKSYQSRNVFPSSRPDRTLHPQEKAEIDAALQKTRLFGSNASNLLEEIRKKKMEERLNPL